MMFLIFFYKGLEKLTNKNAFTILLVSRKKTINNNNKLY